MKLQPGQYRHYKGNDYLVLGTGIHTETREELVFYKPLYDCDIEYFVRPLQMFAESVTVDSELIPRFRYLGPYEEPT